MKLIIIGLALFAGSSAALKLLKRPPGLEMPRLMGAEHMTAVESHAGMYSDKSKSPEFARTVLVTAANSAYKTMLRNWRCHADRLGLDYIVVAMDEDIYADVGPEMAVLVDGTFERDEETFRTKGFNVMSCNKIKMVKEIMEQTGLDVVFSDPDNVFGKDPFTDDVHLGQRMRSGKYQYVFQRNDGNKPPANGEFADKFSEGNTGFYWAQGSGPKAKGVHSLFNGAMKECHDNTKKDDQANFWSALKTVKAGKGQKAYGADSFKCITYGEHESTCGDEDSLNLHAMNPFNHPSGWKGIEPTSDVYTFHANFCKGFDKKKAKLEHMGLWNSEGCNLEMDEQDKTAANGNIRKHERKRRKH